MTDVQFFPRDCYRANGTAKVAFVTRREARKVARDHHNGTHPYRCPYCGQFHLGTRRT